MMTRSTYAGWATAGFDAWALGIEAAAVMGLRTAKIAGGGDLDGRETRLMVAEKLQSTFELQVAMITGALGLTPLQGSTAVLRHYKRKVSANRRRLG
jgi:hypothetical protein